MGNTNRASESSEDAVPQLRRRVASIRCGLAVVSEFRERLRASIERNRKILERLAR